MNKSDLENLVDIRVAEATTLLSAQHYHGAYYLIGYALECALKACIAKQVMQYDFPDKKTVNASYSHKLHELIGVAGLQQDLRNNEQIDECFQNNWATAKDWSEESRYEWNISQTQAQNLYDAVMDVNSGVLAWLKNYW